MAKAKSSEGKFECKTEEPVETQQEDVIEVDVEPEEDAVKGVTTPPAEPVAHVEDVDAAQEAADVIAVEEQLARTKEMLKRRFGPYRPLTEETKPKFKQIQEAALIFAEMIFDVCPDSQQRSAAFTLLEQAKMLANASIAIHCHPITAKKSVQV